MSNEDITKINFNTWLSPTQVSFILGLSSERVRGLCREGKLVHVKTKYGRLIDPESVEQYRSLYITSRTKKSENKNK